MKCHEMSKVHGFFETHQLVGIIRNVAAAAVQAYFATVTLPTLMLDEHNCERSIDDCLDAASSDLHGKAKCLQFSRYVASIAGIKRAFEISPWKNTWWLGFEGRRSRRREHRRGGNQRRPRRRELHRIRFQRPCMQTLVRAVAVSKKSTTSAKHPPADFIFPNMKHLCSSEHEYFSISEHICQY